MLHILGASVNILGKLRAVLETPKKILEGLGCVKGRFKVIHFTNTNISFTLPPSL